MELCWWFGRFHFNKTCKTRIQLGSLDNVFRESPRFLRAKKPKKTRVKLTSQISARLVKVAVTTEATPSHWLFLVPAGGEDLPWYPCWNHLRNQVRRTVPPKWRNERSEISRLSLPPARRPHHTLSKTECRL